MLKGRVIACKVISFLLLPVAVFAADGASSVYQEQTSSISPSKWEGVIFGASLSGLSDKIDSSHDAVGDRKEIYIGYNLGQKFDLGLIFGKPSWERFSSAGDLADWQNVEQTSALRGDYQVLDAKYTIWTSASGNHKFLIDGGFGVLFATSTFDYNRYKPNNAVICFGPCGKVVEESSGGSTRLTAHFFRSGFGYRWRLGHDQKVSSYDLLAGADYTQFVDRQNPTLGEGHTSIVGTDLVNSIGLNVGLSIRL